MGDEINDVLIIGAGPSGLSCARKILDSAAAEDKQVNVVVLEVRDRIGGRCYGDMGAGYVDERQRRVHRLVDKVGLELYSVHDMGNNLLHVANKKRRFKGTDPSGLSLRTLLALGRIVASLEVTSAALPLSLDPGTKLKWSPWLEALDSVTLDDYLKSRTKDVEALDTVRLAIVPVFGQSADKISLLWFLFYCASNGTLSRLISVTDGAQHKKVSTGGFQELCQRLASGQLKDQGGNGNCNAPIDIRFECEVSGVRDDEELGVVKVSCVNGKTFRARHVVLALQPHLYKRISFSPQLPASKRALADAFERGGGHYAKVRLAFESPWWREEGFSGQLCSDQGPASYFIDDVKRYESRVKYGLVGFICSDRHDSQWRALGNEDARSSALCTQLEQAFFPNQPGQMPKPIAYEEYDWTTDLHSAVCVPVLSPGAREESWQGLREFSCWNSRLVFAGTESALVSNGYVDGAIWAGERAAHEILGCLNVGSTFDVFEPVAPGRKKEKSNSRGAIEHFFLGRLLNESRSKALAAKVQSKQASSATQT